MIFSSSFFFFHFNMCDTDAVGILIVFISALYLGPRIGILQNSIQSQSKRSHHGTSREACPRA